MDTSRFDYDRRSGATVDPTVQKYSKWIRVSEFGVPLLRGSTGSSPKKIFAIVAPPMPADLGCKTIRRILIFDNHPDSLRLVSRLRVGPDVDLAAPRYRSRSHLILGLLVIIALVLATIWPLFIAGHTHAAVRFSDCGYTLRSTHSNEGASSNSSVASQNLANAR